jgi:hypothetical protein
VLRAALVCALAAHAAAARAQDFEHAGHAGPAPTPGAFLDTGLPPAAAGLMAEALGITRYALPELSTRGAAAGAGWRSLRAAAGLSQTGDPELGWNAFGAAAGVANARWGAGLRAIARRDRTVLDPLARWGGEFGGGVWLRLEAPLAVWATAPAAWTAGGSPPLERGLALGVIAGGAGASAWFEHEARPEAMSAQAAHRAGVALEAAGFTVWAEGLDAPLRAALGIEARAAMWTVALSVVSHPLLGETARAALVLGGTARTGAGGP